MEQRKPLFYTFFTYFTEAVAIAPGGVATSQIAIQADSDFEWIKSTYFADIAAAAQTDSSRVIPLVDILLTDTGSGRQLTNAPLPIPLIFGTGEIPFILPVIQTIKANSNVTVSFTNFDAAATYNVTIALIGRKVFYS